MHVVDSDCPVDIVAPNSVLALIRDAENQIDMAVVDIELLQRYGGNFELFKLLTSKETDMISPLNQMSARVRTRGIWPVARIRNLLTYQKALNLKQKAA